MPGSIMCRQPRSHNNILHAGLSFFEPCICNMIRLFLYRTIHPPKLCTAKALDGSVLKNVYASKFLVLQYMAYL